MPAVTIQHAAELALRHYQAGRLAEAETLYRQILAVQPHHVGALHHLGIIACKSGHHQLGVEYFRQVIGLNPSDPIAYSNLGAALADRHRFDEAVTEYRRALELKPDYPEAHHNLASAFWRKGRLDEAIASCRRALQLKPAFAEAHNTLGNALKDRGQIDKAIAAYRRALELQPNEPDFYNNLGNALREQGRLDDGMAACLRALEIKPGHLEACTNLANAFKDRGQLDETVTAFRRAIELAPARADLRSNLLYALHFVPGDISPVIAHEQRQWNREFGEPLKCFVRPHANDPNPDRRLRVGYVSPEFRDHVIGRHLCPLLLHHDHSKFEVLCYSGVVQADELTAEFQRHVEGWRSTVGVSDEALVEMIRQDGVDILVDLTQHLAGNRLPVFACQPAPVEVSFAGYPASTGVESIAYRLSDRWLESESGIEAGRTSQDIPQEMQVAGCRLQDDSERNFHPVSCILHPASAFSPFERVYLIDSFWCYHPHGMEVEVNPLPAKVSGTITFGSLNNFCKINDLVLRLWSRVLAQVKDSRLILLTGFGSHRQRTLEFLAREGVQPARVEFAERRPHREYLKLYHGLDIVLDPFPYGGHTTSLDALWMGVPVVSLAGERSVSRAGLSILNNLGLPELVALSEEDYVKIAAELAGDLPRLAELRRELRSRMEASVLMDAPRFARRIEAAYRSMWRCWCAENHAV